MTLTIQITGLTMGGSAGLHMLLLVLYYIQQHVIAVHIAIAQG